MKQAGDERSCTRSALAVSRSFAFPKGPVPPFPVQSLCSPFKGLIIQHHGTSAVCFPSRSNPPARPHASLGGHFVSVSNQTVGGQQSGGVSAKPKTGDFAGGCVRRRKQASFGRLFIWSIIHNGISDERENKSQAHFKDHLHPNELQPPHHDLARLDPIWTISDDQRSRHLNCNICPNGAVASVLQWRRCCSMPSATLYLVQLKWLRLKLASIRKKTQPPTVCECIQNHTNT